MCNLYMEQEASIVPYISNFGTCIYIITGRRLKKIGLPMSVRFELNELNKHSRLVYIYN